MELRNSFTLPLTPPAAWPLLLDVPRMARAMPGAELTEAVDAQTWRGSVAVKLGPVRLTFAGEARIEELDQANGRARVSAKGSDTKGRGGAQAEVAFTLAPEGEGTRVEIATDLQLLGAVAQYGRGAGLIKAVADQLVGQFADNLRRDIAETRPAVVEQGAAPTTDAVPPPAAAVRPLSGFALLWRALCAMVAGWFKKTSDGSSAR
jgi:carbon monoxide dehydrogenase subunit G